MQDYVPAKSVKICHKIKFVSVVSFVLIVILSCFLVALVPLVKRDQIFKEKKFYLVYTNKSMIKSEIEKQKDNIELIGGAGVVLSEFDSHYLIVNAYSLKSDAQEIKTNLAKTFQNSGVLEVSTKTANSKKQNEIKKNEKVIEFIKFFDEFVEWYLNEEINFLKGEVTTSGFSKQLLKKKFELEDFEKLLTDNKASVSQSAKVVANLLIIHINNFFSFFFESQTKNSLVCSLGVNLVLERVNLFDNL